MRSVCALAIVFLVAFFCGKGAIASEEAATETSVLQRADHDEAGLWNDLGVNPACGDANANTLELGSAALRVRVESCVRSQAFAMDSTALQLLMRNIPVRFDQYNDRPRGCVQMELTVERVVNGAVTNSWLVIVDVDGKTDTQNAHYGYTVQGIVPRVAKETGHIFFPPNVVPPNVRPWKQDLGQKVSFTDQITTSNPTIFYRLRGISYNQFYTQAAPSDDQDGTGTRPVGSDELSRAILKDFA